MFEETDIDIELDPIVKAEVYQPPTKPASTVADIMMADSNSRTNLSVMDARSSSAISPRIGNGSAIVVTENDPHDYIYTWKYYIIKVIFHIMFHITLLSTLEPIFFFNYAIPMERELFYDQVGELTTYHGETFDTHNAQSIRTQPFYTVFIEFLQYENTNTDPTLSSMKDASSIARSKNNDYNDELEYIGYTFPVVMGSITFSYYITVQYVFRYKNFGTQVLGEHISLMIFVAAYEFWFFTNIILKYRPFTTEEIMELITNCMLVRIYEHYPEMQVMEHNVTAVCDSN